MRVTAGDTASSSLSRQRQSQRIREYTARVPPPWVLKPRSEASAIGIRKVEDEKELWQELEELDDVQSFYVLEHYVPGDIFHVDSIVSEREVLFSCFSKYGQPPMDVAHHGGVFMTPRSARLDMRAS